jgi:hypothetical protein
MQMIYPTRGNPLKDDYGNFAYIERVDGKQLLRLSLKDKIGAPLTIATYERRGVLLCKRNHIRHYWRKGRGFGFNKQIFEHYLNFEIDTVRLICKWQNVDETCPVERLIAQFEEMPWYKKQGFEKQMLVPLTFFRTLRDEREARERQSRGHHQAPPHTPPTPSTAGGQLNLF